MAWLRPWDEPTYDSGFATVRGLAAWVVAEVSHCDVRVADAAIGRHVTSTAQATPAAMAAILASAREDIAKMSPEDRWRAP
jgi:hypothetical protein